MLDKLIQEVGMHHLLYFVCSFFGVFAISLLLIPKIRSIAIKLNLSDAPDNRSSHTAPVPTFGGVIFYVSYIVILFFAQNLDVNHVSVTLLASISILFFTGLLDDFKNLSPRIKFLFQIIGVAILMFQPDFRIVSLHGFLGVYEIPMAISVVGSMFFLLALINAFNLIDGIDGLSGITGIIIASFYSFVLFNLGHYFYLSISLATIGTLLAFLRFNFSVKRKIFMGDTGSLVIGLVLGLLTLKLMAVGDAAHNSLSFNRGQLPLFLAGVLFVPTLDTIRVMLLRFTRGVSMFKPDRNHIHHLLLDRGLGHRSVAILSALFSLLFITVSYFLSVYLSCTLAIFSLIAVFYLYFGILYLTRKRSSKDFLKILRSEERA